MKTDAKTNTKTNTKIKMTGALAKKLKEFPKSDRGGTVGLIFGTNGIADEFIPIRAAGGGLIMPYLNSQDIIDVYMHAEKANKQIMGTAYIQSINTEGVEKWLQAMCGMEKLKGTHDKMAKTAILRYHDQNILGSFPQPMYWVDLGNEEYWTIC